MAPIRYKITGILGRRGAGKTLYAVYLLYQYYQQGYKIYSNIKLHFPYHELTLDMLSTLPKELNGSIIFTDEIQMWADAYNFLSKDSKAITTMATQLRKRKCQWIFTTQFFKQAVLRLRNQTDYLITMERYQVDGKSKAIVYDPTAWEGEDEIGRFTFDGRKYFDLYDTNEVVLGRVAK